jgi:hypothetical protein
LIEVIRSSGEELWRVDAYQIPYYSRGIEEYSKVKLFQYLLHWRFPKVVPMGAIVIWTKYDEGTESAEVATSDENRWRHFTDSKSCQIIESIYFVFILQPQYSIVLWVFVLLPIFRYSDKQC